MKRINKLGKIITKILEVFHWVGAVLMVAATVCSVAAHIMSVIVRLVTGVETAEISIDMGGIFMGIIVLCLTQYFVHGADLEKDVDGLL